MQKIYYVYIMSSIHGTLYIGVTNDLKRRAYEHQNGLAEGFTQKYKCKDLVFFESSSDVLAVIAREKQLKKWSRVKKVELVKKFNPKWQDLSASLEMTEQNE